MAQDFLSEFRRVQRFLGDPANRPLFLLLAAFLLMWGFIKLLSEVQEGETLAVDNWILDLLVARAPPAWYTEAIRDVTALGSVAVLVLLTLLSVGFLWVSSRPHLALWVMGGTVTGTVFSFGVKALIERPRPRTATVDVFTHSFPSGHSMMSAVVFLTLGALLTRAVSSRRQKVYLIAAALFLTFVVGISRLLLGVHYPTDVLGGWSAGLAWALTFSFLLHRFRPSLPAETEKQEGG